MSGPNLLVEPVACPDCGRSVGAERDKAWPSITAFHGATCAGYTDAEVSRLGGGLFSVGLLRIVRDSFENCAEWVPGRDRAFLEELVP